MRFPALCRLRKLRDLAAMNAPAGITEAAMKAYIHDRVEGDLAFILQENGVPLALQYNLTQVFTQLRRFSAIADTRQGVRQALREDLQVEENNLQNRAAVAGVVAAWEASKEYASKQAELKAEARLLGVTRPVTQTDRAAMRSAYVATHGEIEETFEPSDDYLSTKIEELEAHEPMASYLTEVTSKKTAKTMGIQTTLDSAGHVRIVKSRQKGQLPQGTEELRTILRVEGNTWCYLAAKYRNNPMMQGLTPDDWMKYTNYLLGDKCYLLKIPGPGAAAGSSEMVTLRPPWSVMLSYEYELRKEAIKRAFRQGRALRECLEEVVQTRNSKSNTLRVPLLCKGGQADLRSPRWGATAIGGGQKGLITRAHHRSGTREVERKATRENQSRKLVKEILSTPWFHLQTTINRFASLTMLKVALEVATVFTFAEFVGAAKRIQCGSIIRA